MEETSYLTLEALASFVAVETLQHLQSHLDNIADYNPKIRVKAAKPCALVFADSSEVEITRYFEDYPMELTLASEVQLPIPDTPIGTNIDERRLLADLTLLQVLFIAPQLLWVLTSAIVFRISNSPCGFWKILCWLWETGLPSRKMHLFILSTRAFYMKVPRCTSQTNHLSLIAPAWYIFSESLLLKRFLIWTR